MKRLVVSLALVLTLAFSGTAVAMVADGPPQMAHVSHGGGMVPTGIESDDALATGGGGLGALAIVAICVGGAAGLATAGFATVRMRRARGHQIA